MWSTRDTGAGAKRECWATLTFPKERHSTLGCSESSRALLKFPVLRVNAPVALSTRSVSETASAHACSAAFVLLLLVWARDVSRRRHVALCSAPVVRCSFACLVYRSTDRCGVRCEAGRRRVQRGDQTERIEALRFRVWCMCVSRECFPWVPLACCFFVFAIRFHISLASPFRGRSMQLFLPTASSAVDLLTSTHLEELRGKRGQRNKIEWTV